MRAAVRRGGIAATTLQLRKVPRVYTIVMPRLPMKVVIARKPPLLFLSLYWATSRGLMVMKAAEARPQRNLPRTRRERWGARLMRSHPTRPGKLINRTVNLGPSTSAKYPPSREPRI